MKHKLGFLIASMLALTRPAYAAADATNYATDLTVLSAAAMKGVVQNVPDHFFAETGAHVHFVFGTAGQIREKVLAGDRFDVVIIPPPLLADLAKRGLVKGKSIKDVGSVRIGAAVKAGDPLPKIGDEAFPGAQNFNNQLKRFMDEGGKVYACRFALQALYGHGEPSLIEGITPISPLDVLDLVLLHRKDGAFILDTWTL